MGVVNVTPDSFSDGGKFSQTFDAIGQAERLVKEGAAIVDVGGQSTRPGFAEVSPEEEIARVVPVIGDLLGRIGVPISADTYKPEVARAALAAGAHVLNDVYGFQGDPSLPEIAAEFECPVILMHQEKSFKTAPDDSLKKMKAFFDRSIALAERAGVDLTRIILDPGIGFLKTQAQNLELMGRVDEMRAWGFPILLGSSRKSVIGNVLDLPVNERLEGTLATTAIAAWHGVELIRVHDVAANVRVTKMVAAIRAARSTSP